MSECDHVGFKASCNRCLVRELAREMGRTAALGAQVIELQTLLKLTQNALQCAVFEDEDHECEICLEYWQSEEIYERIEKALLKEKKE